MRSTTKISILLISIFFLISLTGCSKEYNNNYSLGIIQTKEYKNQTKITFYNEQLELTNEIVYSYPNISFDGFRNALIKDNRLYLQPKGDGDKLDYGKVIAMSLQDGKITEYDFNRTNITDFKCDGQNIYAVSNLNGSTYIDCYDTKTKEIQTFTTRDILIDTIVVNKGRMYGIASDWNAQENFFVHISMEEQTFQEIYSIKTELSPSYLEFWENHVYFVNDNVLYEYQTDNDKMVTHKLPHKNAYNLLLKDEKLYIGCTDIFENTTSYLDVFDINTGEVKQLLTVDGSILQVEVSGKTHDTIYLCSYEKIEKYQLDKGKYVKNNEVELPESKTFFVGGFFINETNTTDDSEYPEGYENLSEEETTQKLLEDARKKEVVEDDKE